MKVAISFDDGFLDQFKWARALWRCKIEGTFYVNPFRIGHRMYLTLDQLKRMREEWGHTIGNHLWIHEAPMGSAFSEAPVCEQVLIRDMLFAAEWLDKNGFDDGSLLVALPFGSKGGGWSSEIIHNMLEFCDQIRDIGDGINLKKSKILTSRETIELIDAPDSALVCYYFHCNDVTTDTGFLDLLYKLREADVEFTSMRKEAQNV